MLVGKKIPGLQRTDLCAITVLNRDDVAMIDATTQGTLDTTDGTADTGITAGTAGITAGGLGADTLDPVTDLAAEGVSYCRY